MKYSKGIIDVLEVILMSKKKKALEAQRKIKEKKMIKTVLFTGIALGLCIGFINGCIIGYTLKKKFSKDGKKRLEERAFYKARLGEIKHSLYLIKSHLACDQCDDATLDEAVAEVQTEIDNV